MFSGTLQLLLPSSGIVQPTPTYGKPCFYLIIVDTILTVVGDNSEIDNDFN